MLPHSSLVHPHLRTRRHRVFKDIHGRSWSATVDTNTNDPTTNLTPHGWKAPWNLPEDCIRLVHDETTGNSTVELRYGKRKADLREAHRLWTERLLQVGYQRGGDDFDPKNPSAAVLYEVGKKPLPVEPVIAAERGDPWILGFSTVMPAWAKPFFVTEALDEAAFMREAEARVRKQDTDLRVQQIVENQKYEDLEETVDPVPAVVKRPRGRPRKIPAQAA